MHSELALLLSKVAADAPARAYQQCILDDNVLGKPTRTTRERTAQRLSALYALDPAIAPYRVFRSLWPVDPRSQPMLAFLMACWRDPLLRQVTPFVLGIPIGRTLAPAQTVEQLKQTFPQRFGEKTTASISQNLASTWTQAGYLAGKVKKTRARAHVTPVVATFALYLGYLRGGRGELLLESFWARLLDRAPNEIVELVAEASKQGWLRYKCMGSVTEITFAPLTERA